MKTLGVDPSAIPVQMAIEAGIPTVHGFFNEETAKVIREEHGPADAISAAGVFAHSADLTGVMRGIQLLKTKPLTKKTAPTDHVDRVRDGTRQQ